MYMAPAAARGRQLSQRSCAVGGKKRLSVSEVLRAQLSALDVFDWNITVIKQDGSSWRTCDHTSKCARASSGRSRAARTRASKVRKVKPGCAFAERSFWNFSGCAGIFGPCSKCTAPKIYKANERSAGCRRRVQEDLDVARLVEGHTIQSIHEYARKRDLRESTHGVCGGGGGGGGARARVPACARTRTTPARTRGCTRASKAAAAAAAVAVARARTDGQTGGRAVVAVVVTRARAHAHARASRGGEARGVWGTEKRQWVMSLALEREWRA